MPVANSRLSYLYRLVPVMALLVFLQGCGGVLSDSASHKGKFSQVAFSELPGWQAEDFNNSADALRNSCHSLLQHHDRITGGSVFAVQKDDWREICTQADALKDSQMRDFLTRHFVPFIYQRDGFFTGYFEAHLRGSKKRTATYRTPVLSKPETLPPNSTREYIEENHRDFPVLFWTDDPTDLFLAQIQGSARVTFTDGTAMRIGYGGHNGYGYTSIGQYLMQSGKVAALPDGWLSIRAYLDAHPEEAQEIMWRNRRYIFFDLYPADDKAPYGRLDTPLIPLRSLAADSRLMPFGVPTWIEAESTASLMFIHDTGSAIKGIGRGDIFFGRGELALDRAARLRSAGKFYILLPVNYVRRTKL